jgi:hypothetical protein
MLEFVRALRRDRDWVVHAPGLLVASVIAELFYEFHSFTLECAAFLATWALADAVAESSISALRARRAAGVDRA